MLKREKTIIIIVGTFFHSGFLYVEIFQRTLFSTILQKYIYCRSWVYILNLIQIDNSINVYIVL